MKTGIELIATERERQIEEKGYTPEHDAEHVCGELSDAAICYAARGYMHSRFNFLLIWPWYDVPFPNSEKRIENLIKAGALIAAEIDRIQQSKLNKL